MTAEQFLNALNVLESIDEVPGMPVHASFEGYPTRKAMALAIRFKDFRANPIKFLRRADDATRSCIWAEVTRRMAGGM